MNSSLKKQTPYNFVFKHIIKDRKKIILTKTNQTMLVVDETPSFPELLKVIGGRRYNIEIDHASSPETGLERLDSTNPPSIIWSNSAFKSSDIDGIKFLKKCSMISPISSRIICGSNLSRESIESMIRSKEIHSHYSSPILYEVDSILSSIQIGIEYHKISLLGHFLDRLNVRSISKLTKTLSNYPDIKKKMGWIWGLKRNWIDFEDRKLELTQLSNLTESVLNKVALTNSNIVDYDEVLSKTKNKGDGIVVLDKIQDRIAFIEGFLTKSKNHLNNSLSHAAKTDLKIAEIDIKVQKLKVEFMDE